MPSGDEIPTACLVSVSFFLCGDGVLVAKHPGQGKGDADSNGCHDDVVDGVIETEQQAEQAGDTGSAGPQAHQRSVHGARRAADGAADKRLEVAQIDAKDGGLSNAHEAGAGGGKGNGFGLAVLGLEGHRQSGRALGHIGGGGQGEPVGHAVHGQLAHVDDGVHVVDAGHHGCGVQAAHDEAAQAQGQSEQGLDAANHAVLNGDKDGADNGVGQISGGEHADQGGDKQIKHGGDNFVQPLFDEAHHPYGDDNRNHVALIAHQIHLIQAEPHALGPKHALCCHRPGVLQVRVDHQHSDDRTQIGVSAKGFCGGIGN